MYVSLGWFRAACIIVLVLFAADQLELVVFGVCMLFARMMSN